MAKTILTPVTLWQDFNDKLPPNEEILSERREEGITVRDVYFYGRNTGSGAGRVKIYAKFYIPNAANYPTILILFEAMQPFDEALVLRYVKNGYGVLCVDYCGEREDGLYTVYPKLVDYANFCRAGRHIEFCDNTARETSWYEWAAVARYAVTYLRSKPEVTAVGALGLRTGGEVLFKIAPYAAIDCMVSVCAAGWLAYRGIGKFGSEEKKQILDEDRHRFIAGVDSQSYAPLIKCPVFLVSAINDKKYNYDRVYDTFCQIAPGTEKAILFSAHGSGLVGSHSLTDIDLFLDKYLRKWSVFITKPITIAVEEDREGRLVVKSAFDPVGEVKEFGIFFTENVSASKMRDWTRVLGKKEDLEGNVGTVPLTLYTGSSKALVYAFVNYSNNFSVTSKILEVTVTKKYRNVCPRSRVIFSEADGMNGFTRLRRREFAVADCFSAANSGMRRAAGYGGIMGMSVKGGIISYRVGEQRYEAPEGVSFRLDAYAQKSARIRVVFYKDEEEKVGYWDEAAVEGGGKWKSILFDCSDFKTDSGAPLQDFKGVCSLSILSDDDVLINNVLWI